MTLSQAGPFCATTPPDLQSRCVYVCVYVYVYVCRAFIFSLSFKNSVSRKRLEEAYTYFVPRISRFNEGGASELLVARKGGGGGEPSERGYAETLLRASVSASFVNPGLA